MKRIFLLAGVLVSAISLHAQCPLFQNCSAAPIPFCDNSMNDELLWNEIYYWDPVNLEHNLAESKIDLSVNALDACGGTGVSFSYVLLLDLDQNGTLETAIVSDSSYEAGHIPYNNAANPGYAANTYRRFDERGLNAADQYRFALQTSQVGDTLTAAVRFNTAQNPTDYSLPAIPLGNHKIIWLMHNDGQTDTCTQNFLIKDCKAPNVFCLNGLSVNIMPTQMITLWASDFLLYTEDNITPSSQIKIGVRKAGQGTGFPVDPDGNPQASIAFDCSEIGAQLVELWAIDHAGNAEYCETNVMVQDNMGNCTTPSGSLEICLFTEANQPIENATVEVNSSAPGVPPITLFLIPNANGCFSLSNALPVGANYCFTPVKDDNPLNGVSTYDGVLMSKHILGIEPLNSPYKIIAADINRSGSVTGFDLLELRKVILGIYPTFPNNTSWRFVDKAWVFPNPANPFQAGFPEYICPPVITPNLSLQFIGIKIGDVNGTALPNSFTVAPPSLADTILMSVPDISMIAAQEVILPVSFADVVALDGWQWRLQFNTTALQLLDVIPGTSNTIDNFAVYPGVVAGSWASGVPQNFLPGSPIVSLRLRALEDLNLGDHISIGSGLRAEAYTGDSGHHPLALHLSPYVSTVTPVKGLTVSPASPNPTHSGAVLPLQLEQDLQAVLRLTDINGRVVFEQAIHLGSGRQSVDIPASAMEQAGMYLWQISTKDGVSSGKIVKQ